MFYESEGGMKELIGFNMIAFVMTLVVVWFFGWELERKDKLIFILGEPVIVGILSVGVYLM